MSRLDKDAIQVIREEMVRSKINNCASGWFEYDGAIYELVLVLRKDVIDKHAGTLCPCGHVHMPSDNGNGLRTYCIKGSECNSPKCVEFVKGGLSE